MFFVLWSMSRAKASLAEKVHGVKQGNVEEGDLTWPGSTPLCNSSLNVSGTGCDLRRSVVVRGFDLLLR